MLLRRWLTSMMGIGCSGPPPTRRNIYVECNHSEMHHSMVHGLASSFPGEMVVVERTGVDSQYVGMFHCCFCPPGKQDNHHRYDTDDDDWFNITTWESELTRWAQTIYDDVEHCAIVIEPHDTMITSLSA
ncbi:hypothetical protein FisN_19Hh048 [Fistulifera solaris]|uniref:Uncharacterized protein n=1 Tax=Fistulifera solaris TaxID=1519565 RepID=A0A1Z5JZL0_FISSO|nr:hypothetical protein FisN_19Hh048 [Fistulifera solaris]|eukprot:GAX19473.1 hypothetical protein FisN_19Hh048 [Fistulifera solaris]